MPLRVATLFANMHLSGAELRMLNFARAVNPELIEYSLIVISRSAERDQKHGSPRGQYLSANVRIVDLDEPPWDDRLARLHWRSVLPGIWKLVRSVWRIARALRKEQIDVVELHGDSPTVLGTIAAILARKRFVVTAYGLQFWERPLWSLLMRSIFLLQRSLITDSYKRAQDMNAWFWRPVPTYVIPNGIAAPLPQRSRADVCSELGIPQDPRIKIIGQVSRIQPDKGHAVIVAAACEVLRQYPDCIFLLCGFLSPRAPADFIDRLRSEAARLGFVDKVFIFGYPGSIGDIWQLIDIQVHASMHDSSPISIHESMSLGKPAVGTLEGGIPELIADGETGLIVPKNDPQALAQSLLRLLQDDALTARLGAAARQRYEQRHRAEQMARSLEQVFLKAAGKKSDIAPIGL